MEQNYFQKRVFSSDIESVDFMSLDPSIHEDLDQLKRRINAQKIKADVITDCGDHYSIVGSSGDIYITDLNHCSCFDFMNRRMPCKHVYRFAVEHGVINDLPKITSQNARIFEGKILSEIEHFRAYYEVGIISAEKYVKIIEAIKKGR